MSDSSRVILSRFFGTLAFQILGFYGFFQTYADTKSPYLVGAIGMALFVPTVLLSLKAGVWADTIKSIGRTYLATLSLGAIPIFIFFIFPAQNYYATLVALSLLSLVRAVRGPLYYSVLKKFKTNPANVAKYNTLSWQIPLVLGPSLVSLFHTLGIELKGVLFVALALQLVAYVMIFRYRKLERQNVFQSNKHILSSMKDLNIFERKKLFYPLFADAIMTGFMGLSAILPFLLTSRGADGLTFGYYKSVFHLLSFIAVLCVPSRTLVRSSANHFVLLVFLWGCGVAALAFLPGTMTIGVIIGGLGALDGLSAIIRENLVFGLTTEGELGRISSLNSLLVSTGDEFGEFNTGWMVGNCGVTQTLIMSSILSFGVAFYLNQSFKKTNVLVVAK